MKHTKFCVPALALALALAVTPAHAQTGNRANRLTSDNSFATKAAQGGMAEVKMAELAKTKAQNKAVKDLAERLYTDHSKANDELKSNLGKENVTWPTALDAKAQAEY